MKEDNSQGFRIFLKTLIQQQGRNLSEVVDYEDFFDPEANVACIRVFYKQAESGNTRVIEFPYFVLFGRLFDLCSLSLSKK